MDRDIDLMRNILLKIEAELPAGQMNMYFHYDGYDFQVVAEHCELLFEAGMIQQCELSRGGSPTKVQLISIGRLTNEGYEFLEYIRDNNMWERINEQIEREKLPKNIEMIEKVARKIIDE